MLINNGELFRLSENYLQLDKGVVCKCIEDADLDSEFFIFAMTPEGRMLIPVEFIEGYVNIMENQ